ncbi:ABC transporter substrate-binding protein [Streptomyces sp. SID335]|nr:MULTISPECIES: ABC transporter substrate-binding protein [unclassified Streptomyces]MYY84310.1 ABC transporter substrate-binding protein [Streptomyces sp. SID335]NDZ86288.1 ABC transporter substrate-binding protein [Streptomyces sp. SID10115]NEA04035.1 ABC transporter substrate-binding protein [Streptomyces sp. SID10116]NEB43792.1 ABC transporter substrate-binding protein [Streptomyces sp. SID339]
MAQHTASGWEFTDDRDHLVRAARRPSRLVAYVPTGAALHDHGIRPVGIFGSAHDDPALPDPAKTGSLPLADLPYFGAGPALDLDALLAARPDLVVALTYGGGQVYGIDPEAAKHLEEQIPLVVLDVGGGRSLTGIRDRLTALARSLGAGPDPAADAELAAAERRLTAVAAVPVRSRVLALSPAGPDSVHLARPYAWPDLAALAGFGVGLVDPAPGQGANWSTTTWAEAAALEPDLVLTDVRGNAAALGDALGPRIPAFSWNPELPPSAREHARFLTAVAEALEAVRP